jgi:hypothetical protein
VSARRTWSVGAVCALVAGGAAAWALTPTKVHADPPVTLAQPAAADPWAKGAVDRGNMVQGVLDYRSDTAAR